MLLKSKKEKKNEKFQHCSGDCVASMNNVTNWNNLGCFFFCSFDIDTTTTIVKLKDGSLVLHSPAEATPDLEAVVGKLGNRVSGIIGKFCSAAILKW